MATKNSTIKVSIVGDADNVKKAFGDAADAGDKLGDKATGFATKTSGAFKGLAVGIGGFAAMQGIQAVGGFLSDATQKASDLGETVSKNKTIFGDSFAELDAWASGAPKALGITKSAALEATGTFGNMFTQLGITTDQAKEMSKSNVQLATDFASFHNADPTDVLESMSAAFRGEYDSLQKYVPLINAASVEQKALAMTGKTSADSLTAQEKALATNALMMEGAGQAAGDFARTSDSAANRQKTLNAQFEQAQTTLGTKLLPVFNALMGFVIEKAIPAISALTGFLTEHKEVALALGILIAAAVVPPMLAWAAATIAATWPFLAIGAAIAVVAAGVIYAYTHFDWFRTAIDAVGAAIGWVFNWVSNNWPTLLAILTGPFGVAVLLITRNWDAIKDGATGVYNWIKEKFDAVVSFFQGIPGRVGGLFSGMFDGIKEAFRSAINWLVRAWNGLSFTTPSFNMGPIHIGGYTIGVPKIPYLAAGGIVMGPTLAMIGEAGPEAVVPLRGGGTPGLGSTYNITINVPPGTNVRRAGREFRRYLNESDRAGIR